MTFDQMLEARRAKDRELLQLIRELVADHFVELYGEHLEEHLTEFEQAMHMALAAVGMLIAEFWIETARLLRVH